MLIVQIRLEHALRVVLLELYLFLFTAIVLSRGDPIAGVGSEIQMLAAKV